MILDINNQSHAQLFSKYSAQKSKCHKKNQQTDAEEVNARV